MLTMGSQHSTATNRFPIIPASVLLPHPQNQLQRGAEEAEFVDASVPSTSSNTALSLEETSTKSHHHRNTEPLSKERGTLVVVKSVDTEVIDHSKDPTQLRLNSIPFFQPILQSRDKLAWSQEGTIVRRRLALESVSRIGLLVQTHVRTQGILIAQEQLKLSSLTKEVDLSLKALTKNFTERQRLFAKYAEGLNRITHFAHSLGKCQAVLNDCCRSAQLLNNLLPEPEQLEPFVLAEDTELLPIVQSPVTT